MLVVQIVDSAVEKATFKSRNGGDFTRERQYGIIEFPNGERRRVRIPVPRNRAAYPIGKYTISPASFSVGEWGDLKIAELELLPVAAAAPSARAV